MAAGLAAVHSQSFWARQDRSRRQTQWEVCALMAALGTEMGRDFSGQLVEALDMEVLPAIAVLPSAAVPPRPPAR